MWVGFFVEPSLMQEDIDRLQKFETIPLHSNTPYYQLDLPYGVWRSLSEDFRLSISKENTYEICFRDKCDHGEVEIKVFPREDPKYNQHKALLKGFFSTYSGRKYYDYGYREETRGLHNTRRGQGKYKTPIDFYLWDEFCPYPPYGTCNRLRFKYSPETYLVYFGSD